MYNSFKEWFDDDGEPEELDTLNKVEVLRGLKSLIEIKSGFITKQQYEMAARVRELERSVISYLELKIVNSGFETKDGIIRTIDELIMFEGRTNNINKLTDDL